MLPTMARKEGVSREIFKVPKEIQKKVQENRELRSTTDREAKKSKAMKVLQLNSISKKRKVLRKTTRDLPEKRQFLQNLFLSKAGGTS